MDGIYITVEGRERRPKTKKEIKALAKHPELIYIECTSMFGGYSGPASDLPVGSRISFVGPDPYTKRNFYGNLVRTSDGVMIS